MTLDRAPGRLHEPQRRPDLARMRPIGPRDKAISVVGRLALTGLGTDGGCRRGSLRRVHIEALIGIGGERAGQRGASASPGTISPHRRLRRRVASVQILCPARRRRRRAKPVGPPAPKPAASGAPPAVTDAAAPPSLWWQVVAFSRRSPGPAATPYGDRSTRYPSRFPPREATSCAACARSTKSSRSSMRDT